MRANLDRRLSVGESLCFGLRQAARNLAPVQLELRRYTRESGSSGMRRRAALEERSYLNILLFSLSVIFAVHLESWISAVRRPLTSSDLYSVGLRQSRCAGPEETKTKATWNETGWKKEGGMVH